MRKAWLAVAVAVIGLGALPAAPAEAEASGPVVAAAIVPTLVPIPGAPGISLLVSGEAVGGPGGPTRTFVGSCQAAVFPPVPGYSVRVSCEVNTTQIAYTVLGQFTPLVSVAVSDVLWSVTAASYRFCVHPQVLAPGLVAFPASVCVPFI